ncbi:MAG: hypothetical protein IPN69_16680 [Acidobacteria bacterium]|nr:hypothetical protein [Acidobacteriota bacterium]MBK8812346.1 hypothetical protein [Acidobacteriota bacterium]
MNRSISALLIFAITAFPAFADYKISQQSTVQEVTTENTIYSKGVRERRESKMTFAGDPKKAEMMARMIPNFIEISQCDLKQDVTLSEQKKSYFIDYYDWSSLTPEQQKRRPTGKIVVKGTMTVSSTVTDSGKRQQMFGFTAKWLKNVQTFEGSADSCDGKLSSRIEQEGWFVDLTLTRDSCRVPRSPGGNGGCRPKMIIKAMENPGLFLEGTTKMFQNNQLQATSNIKTTALSKATLDQALFEIPKDWTEVDSLSELMPGFFNKSMDTSATTIISDSRNTKPLKTIAIDYFSGNSSKVNQDELRGYISQKVSAAGMSGFSINSQAELATGKFANVIGVELKKVKESGASKIGGLFGKVTGNEDATKIGDSEAEIVITIYGGDGKTVVASMTATEKVKGKPNDAVKAAIDRILGGLLEKIK